MIGVFKYILRICDERSLKLCLNMLSATHFYINYSLSSLTKNLYYINYLICCRNFNGKFV